MEVLISVDMEGVAGIATRGQIVPGRPDYGTGRTLMTGEASAAAAGAFAGGASAVVINDAHGPMDNLLGEQLDPRVEYVVGYGKRLSMVEGISTNTAVAMFVGYHAGPASERGVLAHAFSGAAFADLRLNGESVTELSINALLAADYGVPVGLVTGDDVICAEAERILPGVHTVVTKRAISLFAARSAHPTTARDTIRAAAEAVLTDVGDGKLTPIDVPAELVVEAEFRPLGAAEAAVRVPGTERTGARSVRRAMPGLTEMMDVISVWSALAGLVAQ